MERNTLVGIGFLVMGSIITAMGFFLADSVPIAYFGLEFLIIGALALLIVPGWQAEPKDAFKSLLKDSIRNIEAILEESGLRNRAYFMKMEDGDVRAFVPLSIAKDQPAPDMTLLDKAPLRFAVNYKGLRGVLLIPPGNEIVKLAKVEAGTDLEEALSATLVEYADLARGVLAIEEDGGKVMKIQIIGPQLSSESPYFNDSLGSPVSCVAACVVAVAKGMPVRLVKETYAPAFIRLTLESAQTYLPAQS